MVHLLMQILFQLNVHSARTLGPSGLVARWKYSTVISVETHEQPVSQGNLAGYISSCSDTQASGF